jgi:hypothetical protein
MSLNNLQPNWVLFLENTLDKIELGTISKEEGYDLIKRNEEVPEEVRIKYGYKKRGRPPKNEANTN